VDARKSRCEGFTSGDGRQDEGVGFLDKVSFWHAL
jgi:hypothetical protein